MDVNNIHYNLEKFRCYRNFSECDNRQSGEVVLLEPDLAHSSYTIASKKHSFVLTFNPLNVGDFIYTERGSNPTELIEYKSIGYMRFTRVFSYSDGSSLYLSVSSQDRMDFSMFVVDEFDCTYENIFEVDKLFKMLDKMYEFIDCLDLFDELGEYLEILPLLPYGEFETSITPSSSIS